MSDASRTILVVDDEQDVRSYLSTFLQDQGYQVITAGNGAECYSLAVSEQPDLITLDITMPEESGVKAYRNLRGDEKTRAIPVIVVTGYPDPHFERFLATRKSAPPPEGFFDKPVEVEALLARVRELIG